MRTLETHKTERQFTKLLKVVCVGYRDEYSKYLYMVSYDKFDRGFSVGNLGTYTKMTVERDLEDNQHQHQLKTRLLSPPISPEGKLAAKKRKYIEIEVSSEEYKDIQWMQISHGPVRKQSILHFLGAYRLLVDEVKPRKKPLKKVGLGSPSSMSSEDQVNESKSNGDVTSDSDISDKLKGLHEVGSGREYGTRSKNRPSKDIRSKSPSSFSLKSSDHEAMERLKIKLAEANLKGDMKEFLSLSSVGLIHDLPLEDIPEFNPNVAMDDQVFLRAIKKLGFIYKQANTSEISQERTIINFLKLTPQQLLETNKRFFAEKARRTFKGQTFKKTDAQKACKIDVNKTSKLYEIHLASGALDDDLYNF